MTIDLHTPTCWTEVTAEQLCDIVEAVTKGTSRDEVLLALLCKFAGIKMVVGSTNEDEKNVVHTCFKDAEGRVFDLEDWQLSDFCGKLDFVFTEMPIEVAWPFKWDRYLMDTSFGKWFHADAMMLRFAMTGDIESLKEVMRDLGDPHPNLQGDTPAFVLLLRWYDLFKNWLQVKYPFVFQKAEPGEEKAVSPVDARQNIMLMLNDNRPQDNEMIEKSNVHDVLSALQHKIEEAKHLEEQMSKYKH